MGFLSLLEVSSMPMVQIIIISLVGAFMATDYLNLLPADARKSLNKIVFAVFTPSLAFASLAQTVRLEDIISWWFMPVNIGITFLAGGIVGWVAVKIIRPEPYLQDIVMAMCAAGNLGNILLIIVPAMCEESGNPFGDKNVCRTVGLSYASFSLALGAFYIWTYAYYLIRRAGERYHALRAAEEKLSKEPNNDLEADERTLLLNVEEDIALTHPTSSDSRGEQKRTWWTPVWSTVVGISHQIVEELKSPVIFASILGFLFGTISWLRNLIIGDEAPLRVVDDCVKLLGDGTIPCITLILGGNLTQGLSKSKVNPMLVLVIICVRYILLPVIGIGVVLAAARLGFLPADPLFHFVLMIQYTLPPAMNLSTMTQLFDVAQEECAVLFLWTYLVAAFAMTGWSTVFMWILS